MFYINYEECKLDIKVGITKLRIGFILTMRNVNNTLDILQNHKYQVLY